jgi:hypothetical protein
MDLTTWTVVGAAATAFAAIATTASAIVVGFQAYHTRRSAQASEDAVGVAQATLRESQMARLEARAPHLHLSVEKYLFGEVTVREGRGTRKPVVTQPSGAVYRTPRDAVKILRTRAKFAVRNNGTEVVELTPSRPVTDANGEQTRKLLLEPGQKFEGSFLVGNKLEEWIRLSKVQEGLEDGNDLASSFTLTYSGPNDFDLEETMDIEVRGTLVAPVAEEGDGWELQDLLARDLTSTLLPTRRKYFVSRTANKQF